MRHLVICAILSHAMAGVPFAANFVSDKTVIVIQPSTETYFSQTALDLLADSSFAITTVGPYDSDERILNELALYTYGVLLYGGHGTWDGNTMLGDTYSTVDDAQDAIDDLVNALSYLVEGDLATCLDYESGLHTICMTPEFTTDGLKSRQVAVISTCDGDEAGTFNAQCRVGGHGTCSDVDMNAD